MKKLTEWIVSRYVPNYEEVQNPRVRSRYGMLEGWASIVINVFLFIVKGVLALLSNSVALLADSAHTLSDVATSIVVIMGFKISGKPSDREHPFGHGRMELVATLIISVLLIVVGVELLRDSVYRLIKPVAVKANLWLIIAVTFTLIVKEMLAQFALHLGRAIESKTLEADFWHHRSDVIATILVISALIGSRFGFRRVDACGGIIVSGIIIYYGIQFARQAVNPLLGEPPSAAELRRIEENAKHVDGVMGVHDIIVHRYGRISLVSLHVEVEADMPSLKMHEIAEEVEDTIAREAHGTVVAHVDPIDRDHPRYKEIEAVVEEVVSADARVASFHDLRVSEKGGRVKIILDITVKGVTDREEAEYVADSLAHRLQQRFPEHRIVAKVEQSFDGKV